MKAKQTYLKGKSVFKVSLLVIGITILTVFLTGENYNRTLDSNLYLSLFIIGSALFLFMTYGPFKGLGLTDDFPKFKEFNTGNIISNSGSLPDFDETPSSYSIEASRENEAAFNAAKNFLRLKQQPGSFLSHIISRLPFVLFSFSLSLLSSFN